MTDLPELTRRLDLPATEMAASTLSFVSSIAGESIFNHSVRTYLHGRALAEELGRSSGSTHDDELLFLGCVLHDIGLTETGDGDQPFHIDGADLAMRHLKQAGAPEESMSVVWDAIALHIDPLVATRKRPEIAFVSAGAGLDLSGEPVVGLDMDLVGELLPRADLGATIKRVIVDQAAGRPHKAPPFSLPGELVRQATGQEWPTWEELTC